MISEVIVYSLLQMMMMMMMMIEMMKIGTMMIKQSLPHHSQER
jgi:hypothetical protein